MAKCAHCKKVILFGGVEEQGERFCNKSCLANFTPSWAVAFARAIPREIILPEVQRRQQGVCPICGGEGPVDVFLSNRVVSEVYFTQHKEAQHVGCAGCRTRRLLSDSLICLLLGWWSLEGIVHSVLGLGKNITGLVKGHDYSVPSMNFIRAVRLEVAREYIEHLQQTGDSERLDTLKQVCANIRR